MADRVRVQVLFKKALWTCPTCKNEEWEDRPMEGGASYEHTCSKCGAKFNQSGANMKEYNSSVHYTPAEYEALKSEDLAKDKQKAADDWIYSVKNPPAYVEPTVAELEKMKAEKQAEVDKLQEHINAKVK